MDSLSQSGPNIQVIKVMELSCFCLGSFFFKLSYEDSRYVIAAAVLLPLLPVVEKKKSLLCSLLASTFLILISP